MLAGVPYLLLVLLGGLITGAVLAPLARSVSDSKLAGEYYRLTAPAERIPRHQCSSDAGPSCKALRKRRKDCWNIAWPLLRWHLRSRDTQKGSQHLLEQSPILAAIRMTVALTFVTAGIGKAFNMPFMTQFFTQPGYSVGFLNFIMIAEVLGAVGLLFPWASIPALLGFTIDMFGAVVTHVHNGDLLDDSTGAIAMLIRLAAIAALVMITPHGIFSRFSPRSRVVIATTTAVACLSIALAGNFLLHAAK